MSATTDPSIESMMTLLGVSAREAAAELANSHSSIRNLALQYAASAVRDATRNIALANNKDMVAAREKGLTSALLDRLALDESRIAAMADGIDSIVELPDPLGKVMAEWDRPNGLHIQRISVPLGVIGIIYESRPNVTADAASLCLKSGNAVILRGGSESFYSSQAIYECMQAGIVRAGLPGSAVQMIPITDRAAVGYLLSSMAEHLDVVVPRGGRSLIERVRAEARVPVIGHLEGLCHVYLHESASRAMAQSIVVNAKMRRTGICGAAETLLVDRAVARDLLPPVLTALSAAGCEIRGDDTVVKLYPDAHLAMPEDWSTEYLDAIVSVRVVEDLDDAMQHIRRYGSGHTECIVAEAAIAADRFVSELDSAILLHNASTQFADGGEFGMGAEIGIATDRIHARGPVGAQQLTSYKYVVRGNGQVRD